MSYRKLTPKEVHRLRGKYKARKRGESMAKRTARKHAKEEREYQEKLAKDISRYI